jgi:uncharacterized membrane protein YfcA
MFYSLSILFGSFVGFALGLTGGGGSLLAVPLLVYGLSIAPREAFGISLAAVGATALIGLVQRIRAGQVEIGTGVLFAIAGMIGAPAGIWLAGKIPETVLLILFAGLMLVIAWNMWREFSNKVAYKPRSDQLEDGPTCKRMENGKLKLTSRCALLLSLVGLATGFLSGMFGVGGGIVIVPALVMFSGMQIQRAVGTSLLVIVLISISGVSSHFLGGRGISVEVTSLFVAGGILGLFLGHLVSRRISSSALQKVFATGIVVVAIFIVIQTLA